MVSDGKKQGTIFQVALDRLIDINHPLCILSHQIDWSEMEDSFSGLYCHTNGRPAKPIRLMVGLHYLKYTYNQSDEDVVARWVENPYWQYFCGEQYFQTDFPLDPSSMTRWRNRVKESDLEQLLQATLKVGLKIGAVKRSDIKNVNVDTTVQPKNIDFPTDAKLVYNMILRLGNLAKSHGVKLKQSFARIGKKYLLMQGRFRRANKHKEANNEIRKLKRSLRRLIDDVQRKLIPEALVSDQFIECFDLAERLLMQHRNSKNKIYSLHEPDVDCISKGKSHKKYEFGCKVGVVATSKSCFILSSLAFHGAPYDGHTLAQNMEQAERITDGLASIENVFVDQGYRKHNYTDSNASVNILKRGWRKTAGVLRRWYSRRSAVEPVIGHMKSDCRLDRNYLKGKEGDQINAILSACGFNMRKLLAHIFCFSWEYCQINEIIAKLSNFFLIEQTFVVSTS